MCFFAAALNAAGSLIPVLPLRMWRPIQGLQVLASALRVGKYNEGLGCFPLNFTPGVVVAVVSCATSNIRENSYISAGEK